MNGLPPAAVRSQCRVDVFGEHVSVHLQVANDIRTPPAIAATEQAKPEQAATAWVGNGVDFVELNSDHAR